jgi:transposase
VAQAARDLDIAESVLRRWMRELTATPAAAFARNGQMRADLAEIAALKKEVARLRAERDILKKAEAFSRARRHEVRLFRQASSYLARQLAVRRAGCVAVGLPCLAQSSDQQSRDP